MGCAAGLWQAERLKVKALSNHCIEADREHAGCFSSEIDSYRIALEVDGYLTGISPLRARCIVLVGEALVNRGREDA